MTRRLTLLIAVVVAYDLIAYRTRKAPTITHLVHVTRSHFRPHCVGCVCDVRIPPPQYRGFLR